MWSKILIGYGKRIFKVLLWFVLLIICFGVVFYLYEMPLAAVGYAAILALVPGVFLLLLDFLRYLHHVKEIILLLGQKQPAVDKFLPAMDLLEEEYQKLAQRIYSNKKEAEWEFLQDYADMMDYYTLWVHQIKTPISAINLLLQTDDSPNSTAMSMELFKIEQYTDMVLQYLRLGSAVNDFVLQNYELDDMIRQALRKYAKIFIGKKISVDYRKTNRIVLTDEKWMVFVIEQLLSNALKYTDRGKISIYSKDGGSLTIEDTGIGISDEDLPRIFEKGYTGFNGRMDKKATGLGLYLCKRILDRLSQKIIVESVLGKGTKVTVTLLTDEKLSLTKT